MNYKDIRSKSALPNDGVSRGNFNNNYVNNKGAFSRNSKSIINKYFRTYEPRKSINE